MNSVVDSNILSFDGCENFSPLQKTVLQQQANGFVANTVEPVGLGYSFVVPVYNDAYFAEEFCVELRRSMQEHLKTDSIKDSVEIIFVDDGSKNDSVPILIELTKKFDFVRVIELSRNFGQHVALSCGFREAKGALVGRLNIDMQDHPRELSKLLKVIESEDVDIVIGMYNERKSPLINNLTSRLYFWFFNLVTGFEVPQATAPIRIMNRRYIDSYNLLREKSRFPQGLDEWFGFKKKYVLVNHSERSDKRSSYNFVSRLAMAVDGVLSFSDQPLKIILYSGMISAVIAFSVVLYLVAGRLLYNLYVPGYVSLITAVLGVFSIQIMCIGVMGLYIGRILRETQDRPLYVIRRTYPH